MKVLGLRYCILQFPTPFFAFMAQMVLSHSVAACCVQAVMEHNNVVISVPEKFAAAFRAAKDTSSDAEDDSQFTVERTELKAVLWNRNFHVGAGLEADL